MIFLSENHDTNCKCAWIQGHFQSRSFVRSIIMILNFSAQYLDCLTFVLYLLTQHTTSIITTNRTKEMLPITDPVMTAVLSFGIVAVVVSVSVG